MKCHVIMAADHKDRATPVNDVDDNELITTVYGTYTVSQKSSTSYFAEYFRAGLTDCKNFNGYRVRDNKRTQVCNQCFNF